MKKTIFLLLLLFVGFQVFSQCHINPFIQDNYELDAKILALREILSNPSDPDYDKPFLPEVRYRPYLERLSALYENPHNSPMVDSLFNEFKFHVNTEYTIATPIRAISFSVDNNTAWLENFKTTGVSGVTALDDLMTEYFFSVDWFYVLPTKTIFNILTTLEFLNVTALEDDFGDIPDIISPNAAVDYEPRFNYIGIPYLLNGFYVELCDIWVDDNTFTFGLWGDDCMAGCQKWEFRFAYVTKDCEVLSTNEEEFEKISIYPNPASDKLYFSGNFSKIESLEIFSIQGKLIQKFDSISTEIDILQLKTGIYFVKLMTSEGKKLSLKFIKK